MRRLLGAVLSAGHIALLLACVSGGAERAGSTVSGLGGIAVSVFADQAAMRQDTPGPHGVVSQLDGQKEGRWAPIFFSLDPRWTLFGLAPGRYRLHFPARLDEEGHVVRLADEATVLLVEPGKVTESQGVYTYLSRARVFACVETVVVVTVMERDWLKEHGLSRMVALTDPSVEIGPRLLVAGPSGRDWEGVGDRHPPLVSSHFPEAGVLCKARRTRVVFALSEPLRATSVDLEGVTVLGEASGLIPGQVSYDAERRWVVWDPAGDMPRGDTFHATLSRDVGVDSSGEALLAPCSFSFRTTR